MKLLERPDGVRIIRIDRPEEALLFRANFVGAYQTVWSEPPYSERFYPSEAAGRLRSNLSTNDHITLLAVRGVSQVVGFGFGVPLASRSQAAKSLRGLVPIEHTYYLAELGVLPAWRGKGIGRQLIDLRLQLIERRRFNHVVLRTSAHKNFSYDMYLNLDFADMGVYQEVESRRTDGSVQTDRRLFLCRVLDPATLPDPESE